jgi:hypothetical protein
MALDEIAPKMERVILDRGRCRGNNVLRFDRDFIGRAAATTSTVEPRRAKLNLYSSLLIVVARSTRTERPRDAAQRDRTLDASGGRARDCGRHFVTTDSRALLIRRRTKTVRACCSPGAFVAVATSGSQRRM